MSPRAGWNLALEQRTRDAAPTARALVEARLETSADVRQRADQWQAADTPIDTNLEFLANGGVRLKATAGAAVGSNVTGSTYRSFEAGASSPFIDPLSNQNNRSIVGVSGLWSGTQANVAYGSLQAWLNPRFDTTKPKYVKTWVLTIYRFHSFAGGPTGAFGLVPEATATALATTEALGAVPFTLQDATGHPVLWHPDRSTQIAGVTLVGPKYLVLIHGYDAQGNPATNIGWAYDGAHSTFTQGAGDNLLTLTGTTLTPLTATVGGRSLTLVLTGGPVSIPALQFIPHTFAASATLTFKTLNPIDLGSTPATSPELVVRVELPSGTSITPQAAVDPAGAFTTFADGQTAAQIGLATQRKYDMRVTLNASAAGDRTPVVYGLGARVVTTKDLGDLCTVQSMTERIDPITHASEIGEAIFSVLHDGVRDFNDAITQLLSQNTLAQLFFRVYWGDRRLSKGQWLHQNDYLIEDQRDTGAAMELTGVTVLSLLKQALPVLKPDAVATPSTTDSNPGVWTASTGTDLAAQIADVTAGLVAGTPDDTTYIQSPSNPSAAQYTTLLTGIATPQQSVGATLQCRAAVAAGGQSLSLKLELLEGATVKVTWGYFTVNTVDAGQGSYTPFQRALTATEQASIGNWSNLKLRITANGTGQIRVGWARLVVLGISGTARLSLGGDARQHGRGLSQ